MNSYEPDKLQCAALTQEKKRCTRIGTHSNGGKVLCTEHHQIYMRDKANAQPIKKPVQS